MNIFKKSKFVIASVAVLGALVVSQSAQANYTRSCEAVIRIIVGSSPGGYITNYHLDGHTAVPEITVVGSPDGSNTAINRRKATKSLSAWTAATCINQWNGRAISALNNGQDDDKVVPPSLCKDPENNVNFSSPNPADVVDFIMTSASVNSLRWAYKTGDNDGWYDSMQRVCTSYGSGLIIGFTSENRGDSECGNSSGQKIGYYRLDCNGGTPTHLTYSSGEKL